MYVFNKYVCFVFLWSSRTMDSKQANSILACTHKFTTLTPLLPQFGCVKRVSHPTESRKDKAQALPAASSPTDFSGRVDRLTSYWEKPKVDSTCSIRSSTPTISSEIWLGRQKMWPSSCVKPRARNRPCMVPERSYLQVRSVLHSCTCQTRAITLELTPACRAQAQQAAGLECNDWDQAPLPPKGMRNALVLCGL